MRPVHTGDRSSMLLRCLRIPSVPSIFRVLQRGECNEYCSKSNKDATTGMPTQIVKHAQRDPTAGYRPDINPSRPCSMTIALAC